MNKEGLDFEVRNLADYSAVDLEILYGAITTTIYTAKKHLPDDPETPAIIQCMDIWCYRIKDALSQAKKKRIR